MSRRVKSDSEIEVSICVNYLANARDALAKDGHTQEAKMATVALEIFRTIEKRLVAKEGP